MIVHSDVFGLWCDFCSQGERSAGFQCWAASPSVVKRTLAQAANDNVASTVFNLMQAMMGLVIPPASRRGYSERVSDQPKCSGQEPNTRLMPISSITGRHGGAGCHSRANDLVH